jgi:very-short-patch-repair endonuclease
LLSHYSANELLGFVDRLGGIPHVTVGANSHRSRRGIRVHRANYLDPLDRREHLGIPITSPALSLLDLGAVASAHHTRRAIRRALGMGKVTVRQLGMVLERYPGRRGAATLREAVRLGATPTKSDGESDVLDIVLTARFERPDVNKPLRVGGRLVIPDMRWPAQRLILEIDSKAWHSDPLARADDRERQALLEASGERVLRVDWLDAVLGPSKLVQLLVSEGAPMPKGE